MEENKVCLVKLISGEPRIGKLVADDRFEVQFVVPGLEEDALDLVFGLNSMIVSQEKDSTYSKAFTVLFISEYIDFRKAEATKHEGVLTVTCELTEELPNEPITIKL